MPYSLLSTKISTPLLQSSIIDRPRVLQKLAAVEQRALALITAPAGFGKTTLAAAWLRQLEETRGEAIVTGWLSLDSHDNDAPLFFSYLFHVLEKMAPCPEMASISLEKSHRFPLPSETSTLVINALFNFCKPAFLVLDNYHYISNPEVHEFMTFMLNHLPPQMHLVLTSRETPPSLPIHRLRAHGQLVEISRTDLSFNEQETARFLRDSMAVDLHDDEIRSLTQRTEGWIAGLQLSALSLRAYSSEETRRDAQNRISVGYPGRFVIDYLANEVFQTLPAYLQKFLVQTSVLERFNAPLCDEVCQIDDSAALLNRLEQENLFIIPLDEQRIWFRYHFLMAKYLQTYLDARERQELHRRAGNWFHRQNLIQEAIQHMLSGGDMIAAADLMAKQAEQFKSSEEFVTLQTWLNALPDEVLAGYDILISLKAYGLYCQGQHEKTNTVLSLLKPNPDKGSRFILSIMAEFANSRGEPETTLHLLESTIEGLTGADMVVPLEVYAESIRLTGQRKKAIRLFEKAYQLGSTHRSGLITGMALWHLSRLLFEAGERDEAATVCSQYIQDHTKPDGEIESGSGLAQIILGVTIYAANDLEASVQYLQDGIAASRKTGLYKQTLMAERYLARIHFLQGEREKARARLVSATLLAKEIDHAEEIQLMAAAKAELEIHVGNLTVAENWALENKLNYQSYDSRINPEVYLVYLQLLIAQEKLEEADHLAEMLEKACRCEGQYFYCMVILIFQAEIAQMRNDFPGAIRNLKSAILLAAPQTYLRIFLDYGAPLRALFPTLREVAPDFVTHLIAGFSAQSFDSRQIPDDRAHQIFNSREIEIMRLASDGLTNQQISDRLYLSLGTVKWYLNEIYKKLGVHNRHEGLALIGHLLENPPTAQP